MQKLSPIIKIKIAIPFIYLGLAVAFFVATWPTDPELHHYIGISLTITAFIFWLIARIQLGNAFTIAPEAKFIVNTGLYSKLRHPVYYFSILAAVGLSIYIWQLLMVMLLSAFIVLQAYRIRKEEQILEMQFGKDYAEYKASTWI